MTRALRGRARLAVSRGLPLAMLSMLLFSSGCGTPPGPPGAAPGMAPPGMKKPVSPPGHPGAPLTQAPAKKTALPPTSVKTPNPAVSPHLGAADPAGTPANLPGQPPDLAGKPPLGPGTPPGNKPGDPNAPNAVGPVSNVEQAGNTVELASAIISAKGNPFLNKLPKPDVSVSDPGVITDPGAAPPPPANPLENISLLGVVYSRKNPLALVSVGGGENQSQLVHKGEVLIMDGGQVKVIAIKPDSIELEVVEGKQREIKSLPSILNYAASSAGGGNSSSVGISPGGATVSAHGGEKSSASGRSSTKDTADKPELPNLKRLSGKHSPDVDLQEP
jgi:hypothetical protein